MNIKQKLKQIWYGDNYIPQNQNIQRDLKTMEDNLDNILKSTWKIILIFCLGLIIGLII